MLELQAVLNILYYLTLTNTIPTNHLSIHGMKKQVALPPMVISLELTFKALITTHLKPQIRFLHF